MSDKTIAAIVVAAGSGTRAGTDGDPTPKQYRPIAGRPMLARSIDAMLEVPQIGRVLPVIHPDHAALYEALGLDDPRLLPPVTGGAQRQESVLAGLEALAADPPALVLIHDAARPLADLDLIATVIAALATHDGAIPAVPVSDTIKRAPDGQRIVATEDRAQLFAAQTPQGFRFSQILAAHRAAAASLGYTDDGSIAEAEGLDIVLTAGSTTNLKVTLPEDFARAERLMGMEAAMETRIGSGYDVHPFGPGDHVWLGGVRIAHGQSLVGHSDADAGLHALSDAIYGALGEGDIGTHFPPSDMRWKGEPSRTFLAHAARMVAAAGGRIVNLDLTFVCEAPRIAPHVAAMKETISQICGISSARVAVKATTSERLGFTGRKEGLVASAVASIELPRRM